MHGLRAGVLALLVVGASSLADIPVKGGCVIGMGQPPVKNPVDLIIDYAQLYRSSYGRFKAEERRVRSVISDLLEAKYWTQDQVTRFAIQQRELLYIGIASDLAVGRVDRGELPAYVESVDEKIREIELQLGCTVLPG